MKGKNKFLEYTLLFDTKSNKELIQAFNNEVANTAWGTARASFLTAIHAQFDERGFDYTEIGDSLSLSFKNKIKLIGKEILIL